MMELLPPHGTKFRLKGNSDLLLVLEGKKNFWNPPLETMNIHTKLQHNLAPKATFTLQAEIRFHCEMVPVPY